MTRLELVVEIEEGLHTRPAGRIAELFTDIEGQMIAKNGSATLSSMLSIMTLGVKRGETVVIECSQALDNATVQRLRKILGN